MSSIESGHGGLDVRASRLDQWKDNVDNLKDGMKVRVHYSISEDPLSQLEGKKKVVTETLRTTGPDGKSFSGSGLFSRGGDRLAMIDYLRELGKEAFGDDPVKLMAWYAKMEDTIPLAKGMSLADDQAFYKELTSTSKFLRATFSGGDASVSDINQMIKDVEKMPSPKSGPVPVRSRSVPVQQQQELVSQQLGGRLGISEPEMVDLTSKVDPTSLQEVDLGKGLDGVKSDPYRDRGWSESTEVDEVELDEPHEVKIEMGKDPEVIDLGKDSDGVKSDPYRDRGWSESTDSDEVDLDDSHEVEIKIGKDPEVIDLGKNPDGIKSDPYREYSVSDSSEPELEVGDQNVGSGWDIFEDPMYAVEPSEERGDTAPLDDKTCKKFFGQKVDQIKGLVADKLRKSFPGYNRQQVMDSIKLEHAGGMIFFRMEPLGGVKGLEARFDTVKKEIHLDFAEVAKSSQGKGMCQAFFESLLKLVPDDKNFKTLKMNANIDVGGYAWVKYGFVPESKEQLAPVLNHSKEVLGKYQAFLQEKFQTASGTEREEIRKKLADLQPLLKEVDAALASDTPNPKIIRKIACLTDVVPTDEFQPRYTDKNLQVQDVNLGDIPLTLGKACLLGQSWDGDFSLAKGGSRSLLRKYMVSQLKPEKYFFSRIMTAIKETSAKGYDSDMQKM